MDKITNGKLTAVSFLLPECNLKTSCLSVKRQRCDTRTGGDNVYRLIWNISSRVYTQVFRHKKMPEQPTILNIIVTVPRPW